MRPDLLGTVVSAARRSALERERRNAVPDGAPGRRPSDGGRFVAALSEPGIRIIAECKRRSPSKGVLRRDYDPAAIAVDYERHGAAAVSVLTEPTFFDGSLGHLAAVRRAVDAPVLRKDFIVTEYQVAEAKAAGADAVLLIVAALSAAELAGLLACASAHGLASLVEVHERGELERALEAGASLVGINSRNLRTLEVRPSVFDELVPQIPDDVVAVAESGLRTAADLRRLSAAGYDAFLIGERFVTEPSPGEALARLLQPAGTGGAS